MQSEAPDYWNHSVKFCLFCNKEGHLTNECWSTHAINTPAQKELARLAYLASPSPQPAEKAEPVGEVVELSNGEKHLRWATMKFPPVGTKLYAAPLPTAPEGAEAAFRATDQVLDLLVASGNITREKAFQCRDIWKQFFAYPAAPRQAAQEGLHPTTADLVRRFAEALADKLRAAEQKYGYSDGWASPDWMDECRQHLLEHVKKGDPRDVAAYCAFLWHHGASTTPSPAAQAPGGEQELIEQFRAKLQTVCNEAAQNVGKAIPIPKEIAAEWRAFARGEPSVFDLLFEKDDSA